jgi:transposase
MTKKKKISEQYIKREKVAALLKAGVDKPSIAGQVKLTLKTVYNIAKRLEKRRKLTRKIGSKGKKTLLESHKKKIIQTLRSNPFLSCQDLRDNLYIPCTPETIRLYLKKVGFNRRKPRGNLQLTPFHETQRLLWAYSLVGWCGFEHVVYSDECSFWLHDNNHEGWFHQNLSHPLSRDNHSGKIHVWGSISFLGKISLKTFRVNNNAAVYEAILQEGLQDVADRKYGGPGTWIFQQDNSPIHTARSIRNYLNNAGILVLDWPSKSPDLNPIENLWNILKQAVRKRLPKTLDQLENFILEEWRNLEECTVRNLCASVPSRVLKCIQVHGKPIEY